MSSQVRDLYLKTAGAVIELISCRQVESKWGEESVLERFNVGDLAGHLARSVLQVEWFLDAPVPNTEPIDTATYYAQLQGFTDLDSDLNVGVRAHGAEVAQWGHRQLVDTTRQALDNLRTRLVAEPSDRRVDAFGRVLVLDEYLRTRLIEMTVHIDDLNCSVDVDTRPPEAATDLAVNTLVQAAIIRHGTSAVLRSLTRRERDKVQALRVL